MAKDTAEKSTQEFLDNLKIEPKFGLNDIKVSPSIAGRAANIAEQNFPQNTFHTSQNAAAQETKPKENPPSATTTEPTQSAPKAEPEEKFSIRGVLTGLSYHLNSNFHHAKHDVGGTFDMNKPVYNPQDGQYYATYIPNNQHYNEFNPGGLIGISIDRSNKYTKGFNLDWRDAEVFFGGYKNSYNDPTIVGGVNYSPVNYKIETRMLGDFLAKAGVTAGVAYTTNGTYRYDGIPIFGRDFTLEAMGLAIIEHKNSGLGIQTNFVPPIAGHDGMVSGSLSYRFR